MPLRRPKDEPRVAVGASLGGVTFLTTHLSFRRPWNRVQLHRLLATLRGLPGPQVLFGDLNVAGRLPRTLREWTPTVEALTFAADAPRLQLDHVLVRRCTPTVRAVEVLELGVSDHRAVVVDLDFDG